MGLINKLDLDNVTFGDLYRFVDHARSAGISDDQALTVETTDELGNSVDIHTLVVDLGSVDHLDRPVLINRTDAVYYVDALHRVLTQSDGSGDREVLSRLADDLAEIEQP